MKKIAAILICVITCAWISACSSAVSNDVDSATYSTPEYVQAEDTRVLDQDLAAIEDAKYDEPEILLNLDGSWISEITGIIATISGDEISHSFAGNSINMYGTFLIFEDKIELTLDDGRLFVEDFKYADGAIYMGIERMTRISAEEISNLQQDVAPPFENLTFNVGEMALIDDWEFSIISFEFKDVVNDGRIYFDALDGERHLYANVSITNLATTPRAFQTRASRGSEPIAAAVYRDDFLFARLQLTRYSNCIIDRQIPPLASVTGAITFNIAEQVALSDRSLRINFLFDLDVPTLVNFELRH